MKSLQKSLLEEYCFWEGRLTAFDKSKFSDFISTEEVLKGYYILIDYFLSQGETLSYGIKDFTLIGSAVGRQFTAWRGKSKWTDKYQIAATLFFGINKNHAFSDGNKRTSMLILLYYLVKNNFTVVNEFKNNFERLALRTAANELDKYPCYEKYKKSSDSDIFTIAHIIKKSVRKMDKSYAPMTFQEFFSKLRNYGFEYELSGGYVDIFKKQKRLFSTKNKKVIQIGCPGLKRQINVKAAKSVLKACELTDENGYDFRTFLEGNESMYKIISDFEAPLRRLKDN